MTNLNLACPVHMQQEAKVEADNFAALAWGSGSTQGYCEGRAKAGGDYKPPLTAQIGLKKVTAFLKQFVETKEESYNSEAEKQRRSQAEDEEPCEASMNKYTVKGKSKPCIVFKDHKVASEAYRFVRRNLKTHFQQEAVPIKVFKTAEDLIHAGN